MEKTETRRHVPTPVILSLYTGNSVLFWLFWPSERSGQVSSTGQKLKMRDSSAKTVHQVFKRSFLEGIQRQNLRVRRLSKPTK